MSVVHKLTHVRGLAGYPIWAGPACDIDADTWTAKCAHLWRHVTCKRCLSRKPKGRAPR